MRQLRPETTVTPGPAAPRPAPSPSTRPPDPELNMLAAMTDREHTLHSTPLTHYTSMCPSLPPPPPIALATWAPHTIRTRTRHPSWSLPGRLLRLRRLHRDLDHPGAPARHQALGNVAHLEWCHANLGGLEKPPRGDAMLGATRHSWLASPEHETNEADEEEHECAACGAGDDGYLGLVGDGIRSHRWRRRWRPRKHVQDHIREEGKVSVRGGGGQRRMAHLVTPWLRQCDRHSACVHPAALGRPSPCRTGAVGRAGGEEDQPVALGHERPADGDVCAHAGDDLV